MNEKSDRKKMDLDETYRLQGDVIETYVLPVELRALREGYAVHSVPVLRNLCGWRGIPIPSGIRKPQLVTLLSDPKEETCASRLARVQHST